MLCSAQHVRGGGSTTFSDDEGSSLELQSDDVLSNSYVPRPGEAEKLMQ